MAGQLGRDVGGKGRCSRFHVSTAFVKSAIVFAQIDCPQIYKSASGRDAPLFSLAHQHRSDTLLLQIG
jgi:hypothetical protein